MPCSDVDNQILLSDNVSAVEEGKNIFQDHMFHISEYHQLTPDLLRSLAKAAEGLKEWWSYENLYTTETVYDEFRKYCEVARTKLKWLNKRLGMKFFDSKHDQDMKEVYIERKQILEDICFDFFETSRRVKRRIIKTQNHDVYQDIRGLTKYVADNTIVKHNYGSQYGVLCNKKGDGDGDEALASMALYKSLIDQMDVAVFTNDSDIHRILHNTCNYLFNNNYPVRNLIDHPIKVYFVNTEAEAFQVTFCSEHSHRIRTKLYAHDYSDLLTGPALVKQAYEINAA